MKKRRKDTEFAEVRKENKHKFSTNLASWRFYVPNPFETSQEDTVTRALSGVSLME